MIINYSWNVHQGGRYMRNGFLQTWTAVVVEENRYADKLVKKIMHTCT